MWPFSTIKKLKSQLRWARAAQDRLTSQLQDARVHLQFLNDTLHDLKKEHADTITDFREKFVEVEKYIWRLRSENLQLAKRLPKRDQSGRFRRRIDA